MPCAMKAAQVSPEMIRVATQPAHRCTQDEGRPLAAQPMGRTYSLQHRRARQAGRLASRMPPWGGWPTHLRRT